MSRSPLAGSSSVAVAQRRGRHRIDRPGGVHCAELAGVRERLQSSSRGFAWLRALLPSVPSGRHTWDFLASGGGRPRTAFAIILRL